MFTETGSSSISNINMMMKNDHVVKNKHKYMQEVPDVCQIMLDLRASNINTIVIELMFWGIYQTKYFTVLHKLHKNAWYPKWTAACKTRLEW